MNHYRLLVRSAAKKQDGAPIFNASLDHAAILAEELCANAETDVLILTGELNARVYGTAGFIDNVRQFLSVKGRSIKVIVENPDSIDTKDHQFVSEFSDHDDIEWKRMTTDLRDKVGYHFMVTDKKSYRFEKDKTSPRAIAAFGDADGGQNLSNVFGKIWEKCEDLKF